jgi:hypothetical protein
LPKSESAPRPALASRLTPVLLLGLFNVFTLALCASAQDAPYARRNTLGVFTAYSPDSSHMLLGEAENRKLLDFGVSYNRRLYMNHVVNWQFSGELLPVALESDPVEIVTDYQATPIVATYTNKYESVGPCIPFQGTYTYIFPQETFTGTEKGTCSRQWTTGEAFSPIGFQWNFLPRHKMQPFLVGHGGYMYSTKAIPIPQAGSFNFTFDLGFGVELFRTHSRSLRAEYRYHHLSNHWTAQQNPGIDNGLIQLTYAFGR